MGVLQRWWFVPSVNLRIWHFFAPAQRGCHGVEAFESWSTREGCQWEIDHVVKKRHWANSILLLRRYFQI
jgi:hypothetical protein